MKFTEAQLEKTSIELLKNENFPHFLDNSIVRTTDEVLIDEDLLRYLLTKYKSKTSLKPKKIYYTSNPTSNLYESNKTIL